jgi:hypothetical protein
LFCSQLIIHFILSIMMTRVPSPWGRATLAASESERFTITHQDFPAKEKKFLEGGVGELRVVMDFDLTITGFFADTNPGDSGSTSPPLGSGESGSCNQDGGVGVSGKTKKKPRMLQCHEVIIAGLPGLLEGKDRQETARMEWEKYNTECAEGKFTSSLDCHRRAAKLMVDHGLRREMLPGLVTGGKLRLRPRCRDFLEKLRNLNVPVLVVTAGLTDIVEEVLLRENLLERLPPGPGHQASGNGLMIQESSQLRILGNRMHFDEEGLLVGWDDPEIVRENKCIAGKLMGRDYFFEAGTGMGSGSDHARGNVIVIGNKPNDCQVTTHIPDLKEVISFGFLDPTMERLKEYTAAFDVLHSTLPFRPFQDCEASEELDPDFGPLLEFLLAIEKGPKPLVEESEEPGVLAPAAKKRRTTSEHQGSNSPASQ